MNITLNNRPEFFEEEEMSLEDLIQRQNYTFKMLLTKVNHQLIKKEDRADTYIKDGDDVSVIHMISGG